MEVLAFLLAATAVITPTGTASLDPASLSSSPRTHMFPLRKK